MQRYGYQHKELGEAVSVLMSFTMSPLERVEGAMSAIQTGFMNGEPPPDAAEAYRTVRRLMQGEGSFLDRAKAMTAEDMNRFKDAVWALQYCVSRAYHEAAAR